MVYDGSMTLRDIERSRSSLGQLSRKWLEI